MKTRVLLVSAVAAILSVPGLSSLSQSLTPKPWLNLGCFDASGHQAQKPASEAAGLETVFAVTESGGTLFENVSSALQKKYVDQRFRAEELPKLVAQFADRAKRATTLREQREIVEEFLSHIPASHLGLLSKTTHRYVMWDLAGRRYPTVGFQLIQINSKYYAFTVLEAGPGARAGVLPWDRIVTIDGLAPEESPRVDWRSDDAYIGDDRDPPVHYLIVSARETINLKIERRPGRFLDLKVPVEDYSAFDAAKASGRVLQSGGRSFGYFHFWYVHIQGVPELLKEKLQGEFSACDGLIIDLRGRGGNGFAISKIVALLQADRATKNRPIVALVDRQSRSAKDVLAYEFKSKGIARLVGEPTAGAVIPASFADVGHDSVLMFPTFRMPRYTDLLDFKPVQPDVSIERAGPFSAGKDPILEAGLAEVLRLTKTSLK